MYNKNSQQSSTSTELLANNLQKTIYKVESMEISSTSRQLI